MPPLDLTSRRGRATHVAASSTMLSVIRLMVSAPRSAEARSPRSNLMTQTRGRDAYSTYDRGMRVRWGIVVGVVGPSLRWATARITKTTRTPATDEDPRTTTASTSPDQVLITSMEGGVWRGSLRAPSPTPSEVWAAA
jgi:hypothetical protein